MRRVSSALLIIAMLCLISACAGVQIQEYQGTSSGTTLTDVEKAIIAGAEVKGWATSKKSDGLIQASLFVRTHVLVVDINYTASDYVITYSSSENLKYNAANNTIHNKYNYWVNNLNVEIKKQLAQS